MPVAHSSARRASSGAASGVPKVAISPSPMNLSSVPPWANTHSAMRAWKSRRSAMAPAGPRLSAMAVKPRMSANRTEASWLRTGASGLSLRARRSTMLGAT